MFFRQTLPRLLMMEYLELTAPSRRGAMTPAPASPVYHSQHGAFGGEARRYLARGRVMPELFGSDAPENPEGDGTTEIKAAL